MRTPTPVLVKAFRLSAAPELSPRYNIAPSQSVPIVRVVPGGGRELALVHWGLIPSWAKDPAIGNRLINARSETAASKPSFRTALRRRRCLVAADGYYEWEKVGGKKQPYWIRLGDGRPFGMAGLWEHWSEGDEHIESCTILTTDANLLTKDIHDRMPVIVHEDRWELWLDPEIQEPEVVQPLLEPFPSDEMRVDPVSTYVNNARHEDARCVEIQAELF